MSRFATVLCFIVIGGATPLPGQTYTDVTLQVGLVPSHRGEAPCPARYFPVESGSAWGDYDGDGDVDFFVTNGDGPSRLYRNDGDTNGDDLPDFVEVGISLGIHDSTLIGHSANFIDYDNDGDQDLFVSFFGSNKMYQNQLSEGGGATFLDVTDVAGLQYDGRAITSVWGDFDQDGLLDLYLVISPYCDEDPRNDDRLFRNNGDGTFADVSGWLCPGGVAPCDLLQGAGFSGTWFDYDNDGDPDLFVANKFPGLNSHPNVLWRNDGPDGVGGWIFTDVSDESGAGITVKSMGLGVGDYDNNGYLDLAISNTGDNFLLQNLGDGTFLDVSEEAGIRREWVIQDSIASITWGTAFFDYDNDGLLDLLYIAGSIGVQPDLPNAFFENSGNGTFDDVSAASGLGYDGRGRSASIADFDKSEF